MAPEIPSVEHSPEFQDGNALASLAILSVNISEGNLSYFDHFVPFIREALATGCNGRGTTQQVTDALFADFGLRFPAAVVRDILKRAERKNFVVHNSHENDFSIHADFDVDSAAFRSHRANALREQASLAQALVGFSSQSYNLEWTYEEAEKALQDFVAQISTSRIKQVLGTVGDSGVSESETSEISQAFIVGEFVTQIVKMDPVSFQSLENLVKGSMLAATLYLPVSPQITKRFRNTTIWIDAPLALLWLGLDGEEAKDYVESLMALAIQQGATLGIFTHSLKELRGIVKGATDGISYIAPGSRPSPLTLRFREERISYAQGISIVNSLEESLSRKGVLIQDAPEFDQRYSLDESRLEEILQDAVRYTSNSALRCDISSITAVHHLRKGVTSDCIEDCRAILMTGNPYLARGARRFFGRSSSTWPTVMVDHEIASLLWSKSPMNAPDLPRNRIIADALSVLQPSPELWNRYMRELDKLVESDHDLTDTILVLRNDSEARRVLMEESLGDPEKVTPELVQEILKEITKSASQPLKEELESRTRELEKTAETLSNITDLQNKTIEEKDHLKNRLERMEASFERQKARAIRSSARWASVFRNGIKGIAILLIIGAIVGFVNPHGNEKVWFPLWVRLILIGSPFVFFAFTAFFSLKGDHFFGIADRVGMKVMKIVQSRKFEKIGLDFQQESGNKDNNNDSN